MKKPQVFLVCVCLLGATQLASGQVKASTASAIPGYLDPATRKFTTQIAPAATAQPDAQGQPAVAGTSLFFREDFQIQIQNYDQSSNASATCTVVMSTYEANGSFEDSATVPATPVGGSWTCDVPLLTQWTLQTPGSDMIAASVTITVYTQATPVAIGRSSSQSLTLAVPAGGQTVVSSVRFQI